MGRGNRKSKPEARQPETLTPDKKAPTYRVGVGLIVLGIALALVAGAIVASHFIRIDPAAGAAVNVEVKPKSTTAPSPEAPAPPPRTKGDSVAALKRIQEQRLILNDHEHIESLEQVPIMLAAMDQLGIQRVALMGSSRFTLTLNPEVGFTDYDWNNEQLLQICEAYPGRFEAWPTINPLDEDKLDKFRDCVSRGATGLKLYLGHGFVIPKTNQYIFHTVAMDDPGMLPVYAFCQENFIPVCLHVNPSAKTPGFADEFIAVLDQFPDLKVVCPHFLLSSIASSRLEQFLDIYPNLYSDIGFGWAAFFEAGIKRISKNPDKFRAIFTKYPTRFFYAGDLVLEKSPSKNQEWVVNHWQTYLDMLTKDTYTSPLIAGETLNGLELAPALLEGVLYKNYEAFLALKPKGTRITGKIDWSKMNVKPTDRQPGQAFPPPK